MGTTPADKQPILESLDTVTAEQVEWLWWPYLAVGKIAILDGEPGVGKSLFSITLAAILSKGYPLPDQQGDVRLPSGGPWDTLLLSAEDSLASTIRPRLDAAKADCSRVKAFTMFKDASDAEGEEQFFTLEHLPALENALKQCTPRLVILDPIQAYLGGKIDINMASQTRPLLAKLARLAEAHHCAILLVRHPAKSGQGRAIHRGLGSIDFIGAARTGLFIEQHPLDANKALLCQTKNNLGPLGRTQIFAKEGGIFQWKSASRITAEDLAGSGRGPDPVAFLQALCWLEETLKGGLHWAAKDLFTRSAADGHAKRTLFRAKKALGVLSNKLDETDEDPTHWEWWLPSLTILSPPLPGTLDTLSSLDPLGLLGNLQYPSGEETVVPQDAQENQEDQEGQECQECQVALGTDPRLPPHTTEDYSSVLEEFDEGIV